VRDEGVLGVGLRTARQAVEEVDNAVAPTASPVVRRQVDERGKLPAQGSRPAGDRHRPTGRMPHMHEPGVRAAAGCRQYKCRPPGQRDERGGRQDGNTNNPVRLHRTDSGGAGTCSASGAR